MVYPPPDAWSEMTELIAALVLNVVVSPAHKESSTAAPLGLGTSSYLGVLARNTSGAQKSSYA